MRTLLAVVFLCVLATPAAAGKKVAMKAWTPPDACIVDRGGVDEEGQNNAGLSRRVLDEASVGDVLSGCDTGIDWKKYRLVRVQLISNQKTAARAVSATVQKGKIVIAIETAPICTGHDVYRRTLVWVLLPRGKAKVQAVQGPTGDPCPA